MKRNLCSFFLFFRTESGRTDKANEQFLNELEVSSFFLLCYYSFFYFKGTKLTSLFFFLEMESGQTDEAERPEPNETNYW